MTTWTGTAPTFTAGVNTGNVARLNDFRDAIKAASEAWTAYTPTWTATTTNPVLGNGSFAGSKYAQVNKLVIGRIVLTMGGTTTYGTGAWLLTLPVSTAASSGRPVILGGYRDTGSTADYQAVGILTSSSTQIVLRHFPTTAGDPFTATTATAPFTWASTDVLTLEFMYEAA